MKEILFAWLRKTQVVLFLVLFAFSIILLFAISTLYKFNTDSIFKDYHRENLQTTAFVLIDDLRGNHITAGPLTQEQIDWLRRRAAIYGVLLKYSDPTTGTSWIDTFSQDPSIDITHEMTVPYIENHTIIGELTIAYSAHKDDLDPVYLNVKQTLDARSQLLMIIVTCLSIGFSLLVARFMSQQLSRLSELANQIRLGKRDVKAPNKGTEEVRKLALTLNEMTAELQKQEKWRENLMEDLTHELKTPLMSIHAQVEAIIDGIYEPNNERMIAIYEELERLSRLLNDLQKLSEAESLQFSLKLSRTNMVDLTRKVYRNFLSVAKEKDIKLTFESTNVPCYALVDSDKMTQVLTNIVSNAIKYTPIGGNVKLSVDWNAEYTTIHCIDSGIGIKEEDQPYVFNRLYRVDKSRSRFSGGVGLGLSIAKAIAEAHNSTITLQSEIGVGSTFTVYIPNQHYSASMYY